MRRVRKLVFWLHLAVGLVAGILVLVMSVTGTLMAFERQITRQADGFRITASAGTSALGPGQILGSLSGPAPSALTVERDATLPVALQFGRERTTFVDPYSAVPLGEGSTVTRGFFKWVLGWHRWLGRDGASQPFGRQIIGIGNLMFLFLLVSGIYLWMPKRWNRNSLRLITLFQKRLKGRGRDWNWHHVFGFWAAIPLLVVVTCGTVISQPWANNLVFRIAGESPPPAKQRKKENANEAIPSPADLSGLDAAFAKVKSANPDWQSIQLLLPIETSANFVVADSHRGRPDQRRTLSVDRSTAEIVKSEDFQDFGPGRQARTWIRWIHTGEAGGVAGQTIAGLAAISSGVLVWTGFALSWRRFSNRRKIA